VPAGYSSLAGWATSSGATTAAYAPGAAYTLTGSVTLYAVFTPNPTATVTFDNNAGTATYSISSGLEGTSITLPSSETVPAGYSSLAGWATSSGATTAAYAPGAAYTLTGSVTLYAVFTPVAEVTVSFDTEGGSLVASRTLREGTSITLPARPTRAQYLFLGWYQRARGGEALRSPLRLTRSVMFYAHWKQLPEVSKGAEIMNQNGTMIRVPVKLGDGVVTVGNGHVGLKIRTSRTATTYKNATITLIKGSEAFIAGYGFEPGTVVRIYIFSNGILLGIAHVGKNGTYSGHYVIPRGLKDGHHSLDSVGILHTGQNAAVAVSIMVSSRVKLLAVSPFAVASAQLTANLQSQIIEAASTIVEYRVHSVKLVGFTDPRGSRSYNIALSWRRVRAIKHFLLVILKRMHWELKRISIAGLGERDAVHKHGRVDNRASRRVLIELGS
ncbi:MAG: InlB B-repeat-containing protein, partial [Acidimicrobiales bacterium]